MASVFYPVQRGFDSVIANWPLLLVRIAESVAILIVTVLAVILSLVVTGLVTAIGMMDRAFDSPERIAEWIIENPHLIAVVIVVALVAGFVGLLVHSFVIGGVIGCFVDAERASPGPSERSDLALFTPERWLAWSARTWWPVFLIYNITWGIFGLVLMVPSIILILLMLATRGADAAIVVTCVGVVFLMLFAIIGGIGVTVWSRVSLALSVVRQCEVMGAVKDGFRLCFDRLGHFIVLYAVMLAIGFGVGGLVFTLSFGLDLSRELGGIAASAIAIQAVLAIGQSLISVFTGTWTFASTVAIANEWAVRES